MLLAAVLHGAGNVWLGGSINVYRGHFGGALTFTAVMAIVSIIIVLIAGPANLSRTHQRNVLELEGGSPAAGGVSGAGPRVALTPPLSNEG